MSGSFSVGGSTTDGDKRWVYEQTALLAEEGLNVEVGGHTQITGAAMDSANGELRLETETLAFADLQGRDEYEYVSAHVGVQVDQSCAAAGSDKCGSDTKDPRQASVNSVDAQYQSHDRRQVTRATVGEGAIVVRGDLETGRDSVAGLNRDLALAQEITRDESRDYDLYVSDSSVATVVHTFDGDKGQNLIETLRPDLIVAEVAGSTVSGVDQLDNAIHAAITIDSGRREAGDEEYVSRGLIDDASAIAAGKRTEASIKATTAGLGSYTTDTGERRRIGEDTTWAQRRDALIGGRDVAEAARGAKQAINQLTDTDAAVVGATLEQIIRLSAGKDDVELLFFTPDANSLGAGALGWYFENPEGSDKAGLNTTLLAIDNSREVMETAVHEGRHGRTEGGSNTEEALATLAGREAGYQWVRRNRIDGDRVGGETSADDWRARGDVVELVAEGNVTLSQIDPGKLDFRQLHLREVKAIERISHDYAKEHGLDRDQARRELTQQALRMVDAKWANQEHITENARAREALESLSAEEDPLTIYALGEGWTGSKEIALFTADPEDYANPYLFANQLYQTDGQPPVDPYTGESLPMVAPALQGYITKYGTANGAMPLGAVGVGENWGEIYNKGETSVVAISGAIGELGWFGFQKQLLIGMAGSADEFAEEVSDTGPKALIPAFTYEGTAEHKALVDQLQGDRESQISHRADSTIGMLETLSILATGGTGTFFTQSGKIVVKESVDQAGEIATEVAGDLRRTEGGVSQNYPEGLAYRANLPNHLYGPDGFGKSGQLSGTHNLQNAIASLDAQGATYRIVPTGTNGISEIRYSYTKPSGKIVDGSKTVYDPIVYSDQRMLDISQSVGQHGYEMYLENPSQIRYDLNQDGINFRVYINIDPATGSPYVGNVHPIK